MGNKIDSRGSLIQLIFPKPTEKEYAEEKKFLGMKTGGVKVELPEAKKIVAYRCPDCGLLRSYAE